MVGNGLYSYFLNPLLLLILTVYVRAQTISITQHPGNDTFCEGSNAVLSCVVFDNSTNDAANTTGWFTDDNPPVRVPDTMVVITRDGDVVTSVLTIESVSLNDNGTGYFCLPSVRVESYVGVISVAATPPAITAIEVTEVCTNDFTVSWTAASNEEGLSYNVTLLSPSIMNGVIFNPVMDTFYNFTGLMSDTEYVVSISSRINTCSGILNTANVTTLKVEAGVPQGVNNLRDVMVATTGITVMWDPTVSPSGCGSVFYYIVAVVNLDDANDMITIEERQTRVEFSNLRSGTSYNISVAAVNRAGTGPSSRITVITSNEEILQRCTITSPSANTIRVSCELLETFERIRVTISSNSCTCSQPITRVGDNPITVPNLTTGVYIVEVTAVNSNNMSIENNNIVEMITLCDKSTATDESDSSTSSDGIAIAITCVVTLLVSVTVTAIVTSVIMYMLMKRKNKSTAQDSSDKVLYEQVHSPSPSITKNDPQYQKNPAYDVGGKVIMDTNPAYESYK